MQAITPQKKIFILISMGPSCKNKGLLKIYIVTLDRLIHSKTGSLSSTKTVTINNT